MDVSISQFRRDLFNLVAKVSAGEAVVIHHKGKKFVLVAEESVDRLSRLTPLELVNPASPESDEERMKADMQRAWERDWATL